MKTAESVELSAVDNPINTLLLHYDFAHLDNIRLQKPEWGLPELLMPSFEDVMMRSLPSFENIMPQLYHEFSEKEVCGILLCKRNRTIVYGCGGDKLHLWYFCEQNGKSIFNFYAFYEYIGNQVKGGIRTSIISDDKLFKGTLEQREKAVGSMADFIAEYVAVKKYVKVESIVVPPGKFSAIENTPLEYVEKKKVINQTGQEVIVMDSKWFRKIINDNDIFVRGFWRMQNKKNTEGEWYKELIFVDSFVRHGYHRNAKIEDISEEGVETE